MASSFLLLLFYVCLFLTLTNLVHSKNNPSNENPTLQVSIYPTAGSSTENIEIRCEISQPLSLAKVDNVYLTVKTDNVKPSGILLMFDDSTERCEMIPGKHFQIDVCNATLIRIHISHTILNETLRKIDYSCMKGSISATNSYRIIKDQSARYYDPTYSSTSSLTSNLFLLLFVLLIPTFEEVRWFLNI